MVMILWLGSSVMTKFMLHDLTAYVIHAATPVWTTLIIDNPSKQWRQRLRACVRAEGDHFEHMMYAQTKITIQKINYKNCSNHS